MIQGTAADGTIRVVAAVTTDLLREAMRRHQTAPTATAALGRVLTGTLLLGATFKDYDRLTVKIDSDGMIGGITGAYLLSSLDASVVKPFVLLYLTGIGLYLLVRGFMYPPKLKEAKFIAPLGLIGGFLDAAGGGGWGPVVTSNLLIQGAEPRKVVGTVNSAEFFLTMTISATFIYHIGATQLFGATLGLLIGGLLAAPCGAWAAKHFPAKQMLILVGFVLTATSAYGVWSAWG